MSSIMSFFIGGVSSKVKLLDEILFPVQFGDQLASIHYVREMR
ncbi:MAG: hypothetical protein ACK492_03705 [Chitinophagaceae bacterium]